MATFSARDKQILIQKIKEHLGIQLEKFQISFSYENIFRSALKTNNAIMILGDYGKSSLVSKMINQNFNLFDDNKASYLTNFTNKQDSQRCKISNTNRIFKYNPNNLIHLYGSVFGSNNKITKEWENSIFLENLRTSLINPEETWFIFDGPIKSEWIEDFNSLFDDNRVICLASGERINVPFCFKFIFETRDISEATPATLTRMYLIKIDRNDSMQIFNNNLDSLNLSNEVKENSTIQNSNLLSNQHESLINLEKLLSCTNTVIFEGQCGSGKKTIIKSLNSNFTICYLNSLLSFKDKDGIVCVENFENASESLKEQVREFWEYGTVGNFKFSNLKIICCIDKSISDLERIPRIFLKPIEQIETFIEKQLDCPEFKQLDEDNFSIMYRFISFFSKTLNLSVGSISKYIKLIDLQFVLSNNIALQDLLYFIFEILYDKSESCKKYLEKLSNHVVNRLFFDIETGFKKSSEYNSLNIVQSKLHFSLFRNTNVTLKGPRLCGKRTLVSQTIEKIKKKSIQNIKEIKVLAWDMPEQILSMDYQLDEQFNYVFILLENSNFINMKFLSEHSIELNLNYLGLHLDISKIFKNENLMNSIIPLNLVKTDQVLTCKTLKLNTTVELSKPYDKAFEESIENLPKLVCFENFFKTVSFFYNFKSLNEVFKRNYEKRAEFLTKGIQSIEKFEKDALELESIIKNQKNKLSSKKSQLSETVKSLGIEKIHLEEIELTLKVEQDKMEEEMNFFEQKRKSVEVLLENAEKTLSESQKCISELSKSQLSEIKSMTNPPEVFRKTIEFAYYLLENTKIKPEWGFLQGYLKKDDFISKILCFKQSSIHDSDFIINHFLNLYKPENSKKVSKTCFALHNWIDSVIKYNVLLKDIIPLRSEVETLKNKLAISSDELNKKKADLEIVLNQTNEIVINKQLYEKESLEIEQKIQDLEAQLVLLEKIILNFESERERWKFIDFKSSIAYLLDSNNYLEFLNEIHIDHNTLSIPEFAELRKSFIEISMSSPSFKNTLTNSMFFKNDLLIKDVNCFDSSIYSLIKQINNRFLENNNNQSKTKLNACPTIIIQGNFINFYKAETYNFKMNPKFKIDRISNLEILENKLLEFLNTENCNLQCILDQQILLENERKMLLEEKSTIELYSSLNSLYDQINAIFIQEYGFQLYFTIFSELVSNLNLKNCQNLKQIQEFFQFTFQKQIDIDSKNILLLNETPDYSYFDVSEVNLYSFDYTFITDFNDIIFELQKIMKIDLEISAGSYENNSKIATLLSEQSNKTILVKNIQFLPTSVKTGTNRFIFIICKNETHSLMNNTRIVYLDKNASFELINKNLMKLMSINRTLTPNQEKLIKFHSLGVSHSLDFVLRDLEICLDNSDLSFEFLVETVYFSKLSINDQNLLKKEIH